MAICSSLLGIKYLEQDIEQRKQRNNEVYKIPYHKAEDATISVPLVEPQMLKPPLPDVSRKY